MYVAIVCMYMHVPGTEHFCNQTRRPLPVICFSLHFQRADDEALTRLLQTSPLLVASPILVKSMFFSFRFSLTLSIKIFLCLPLLLLPCTCPCKAAIGSLSPSIRSTCPNHRSLLVLIFSTTVSRAPSSSLVFLIFACFYSTPAASDSSQSAHLCHQQSSSLILLSQAPTFRALQQHRHYKGTLQFHLCCN